MQPLLRAAFGAAGNNEVEKQQTKACVETGKIPSIKTLRGDFRNLHTTKRSYPQSC